MIKYILKVVKIPKIQMFFLVFTTSIVLFLALLISNGIIGFIEIKESWYKTHDYYRQVTLINDESLELANFDSRKIGIYHTSGRVSNNSINITLGSATEVDYFLDSDINSGFGIIGDKIESSNEIIITYDLYINLGISLNENPVLLVLEEDVEVAYLVVGYFNETYSSYLKTLGYSLDVIKLSNEPTSDFILTVEFPSLDELREYDFDSLVFTYKEDISKSDFYFNIILFALFIILGFVVLLSTISMILMMYYLITENKKTLFLLSTLGMKNKTLTGFASIFIVTFLGISIILSLIINLITKNIFNSFFTPMVFGELNIFELNIHSIALLLVLSVPIYLTTMLLKGRSLLKSHLERGL